MTVGTLVVIVLAWVVACVATVGLFLALVELVATVRERGR